MSDIVETQYYVPVLKAKPGEKGALLAIADDLTPRVIPFLEIVERKKPSVKDHLDTAFKGLKECLQRYPRCFLDTIEIASDGTRAARLAFERASAEGITFTPVTGLGRNADVGPALDFGSSGLALRLTRKEAQSVDLAKEIHRFLERNGLTPERTDLVVDLGSVDDMIDVGVAALARDVLSRVPSSGKWRSLIVSATAFPFSMGCVARNSHALMERSEWLAWKTGYSASKAGGARRPTFSDCAIQHPTGVEGFDPRLMQASATIRYTLTKDWLLIKGQGVRTRRPTLQFPELASRLVDGDLKEHFFGPHHCAGCAAVQAAADGKPGLGSLTVWRRIGTIHHVTLVAEQLVSEP